MIGEATRLLGAKGWRGQEQAAILLARLGHKPAAKRMVKLLEAARPEVFVAAAWGLRQLDVPETLPAVLRYVDTELGRVLGGGDERGKGLLFFELVDHQLSQLNQFLGRRKYAPADAVLRRFIPQPGRKPLGHESRAAAIWALGRIHEGKPIADLVTALVGRLNHTALPLPPEDPRVRRMSAVALGRMRAQAALPDLQSHFRDQKPSLDLINNACGWAIERITGKKMPAPETIRKVERDWFLVPNG